MESEKYRSRSSSRSSDTSSEESDDIKDDNMTSKRSYECTFCKRGFTNAQALGGHMNIHRKDRAKAKQTMNNSSSKYDEDQYLYPTYYSPPVAVTSESSSRNKYYPTIFDSQGNYNTCSQLSQSNVPRSFPYYGCLDQQDQHNQEQLLGANLSMRVGSTNVEGLVKVKDDELDLELRLGN